ncbi:MAG: MoxR family ATPase [Lachnospiraceae bacterium]|nr:MoxR family ATPase [Lachnospiraceae bacterium]
MDSHVELAHKVLAEVNQVILGKEKEVREVLTAFLANGHILIEDIPGVGKTTLAAAFSRALGLESTRVQFTPDVMPSDLTGFSIYNREEEKFVYREGSVFCNLLLADEINRTSPKTQSALLEVMEERKVSVEGVTRQVPEPFLVIATQNPYGSVGTQSLPEAQMDRFMIVLTLGYPDFESELEMAKAVSTENGIDKMAAVMNSEIFRSLQEEIHTVFIKDEVYSYILELVRATRNHPYIERGASPRATIALVKMAKAQAWLDGRDYCTPADVASQFPYVISHRITLVMTGAEGHEGKQQVISEIIDSVKKPFLQS